MSHLLLLGDPRDPGRVRSRWIARFQPDPELNGRTISEIFDEGLHEFLSSVLNDTGALAYQIETDYRFNA